MGVHSDDVVLIQKGKQPGEPCVITVNCPDKTGLGCDLCRIILEFGLCITRGDVSTDGRWCYVVLWVVPHPVSLTISWGNLKNRLLSVCPSCSVSFYFNQHSSRSTPSPVYLLKLFCLNRKGLLHDVTQVLCELELTIQRVKVMTTPDGRVMDLFFITDGMELLHTKKRQDETCEQLNSVLGESCVSCELQLAGPEYEIQQEFSSILPVAAEELFGCELLDKETRTQALSADLTKLKKASVTIDNSLSPAHTLFQMHCVDQKCLLYDIMRTLKDCNIQQTDGKKIVDPEKQSTLCSRLKVEMLHPLRVTIANRGPDTELLVANPVELSGKGRPRVFYDVTLALKMLGICIFSAEIGRYSASGRQWEVYKFLLEESHEFRLSNSQARTQVVDRDYSSSLCERVLVFSSSLQQAADEVLPFTIPNLREWWK
ncbi:PREDICTED: ACT domain-containing protein ACR9-like isoform X2 [Nelumbo nucifera]|uniref:ACT domain-containing protein ACR n=1 Tax=Nelumbo nucifera TaxID=4432 RepID=A0A1U8ADV6_NELNU|nr:PREDICTED: ACT domain-containing protein ACR9-like isoform X2 [Nelumbo nucifera]